MIQMIRILQSKPEPLQHERSATLMHCAGQWRACVPRAAAHARGRPRGVAACHWPPHANRAACARAVSEYTSFPPFKCTIVSAKTRNLVRARLPGTRLRKNWRMRITRNGKKCRATTRRFLPATVAGPRGSARSIAGRSV